MEDFAYSKLSKKERSMYRDYPVNPPPKPAPKAVPPAPKRPPRRPLNRCTCGARSEGGAECFACMSRRIAAPLPGVVYLPALSEN